MSCRRIEPPGAAIPAHGAFALPRRISAVRTFRFQEESAHVSQGFSRGENFSMLAAVTGNLAQKCGCQSALPDRIFSDLQSVARQ